MIRRNGQRGTLLITQNDHAALAGRIAQHWGNEQVPAPKPRDAVVAAVECHDAGWSMHDDKPTLNGEHLPATFYEMPPNWYVRVWVASVAAAAAQGGPMAGLIVSWHFTALAKLVPLETQPEPLQNMLADFVAAQRTRRLDYCQALGLSRSLAECPPIPATDLDRGALYNLWLLRVCDWLSLQFCDNALPELMQKPPVCGTCGDLALSVSWRDASTLIVEPWPLNVPSLELNLPVRRVPSGRYRTQCDLVRVYDHAAVESLTARLAPRSARAVAHA